MEDIVKDSTIELRSFENDTILKAGDDSWLYKDYDGELMWNRYGEEFKASELDCDEFCLLLDLLLNNAIIPYSEYVNLILS